jgi:hypothetical protein
VAIYDHMAKLRVPKANGNGNGESGAQGAPVTEAAANQ